MLALLDGSPLWCNVVQGSVCTLEVREPSSSSEPRQFTRMVAIADSVTFDTRVASPFLAFNQHDALFYELHRAANLTTRLAGLRERKSQRIDERMGCRQKSPSV